VQLAPLLKAAAMPTALPLQDRLATIPGLDVAQALANIGGQVDVLRRVLERFVLVYSPGIGPLDLRLAHSLHGACAAIGAVELNALIQAFESAARRVNELELRQAEGEIVRHLGELIARLRAELGHEPVAGAGSQDGIG
jgi:hypothetical protein